MGYMCVARSDQAWVLAQMFAHNDGDHFPAKSDTPWEPLSNVPAQLRPCRPFSSLKIGLAIMSNFQWKLLISHRTNLERKWFYITQPSYRQVYTWSFPKSTNYLVIPSFFAMIIWMGIHWSATFVVMLQNVSSHHHRLKLRSSHHTNDRINWINHLDLSLFCSLRTTEGCLKEESIS